MNLKSSYIASTPLYHPGASWSVGLFDLLTRFKQEFFLKSFFNIHFIDIIMVTKHGHIGKWEVYQYAALRDINGMRFHHTVPLLVTSEKALVSRCFYLNNDVQHIGCMKYVLLNRMVKNVFGMGLLMLVFTEIRYWRES